MRATRDDALAELPALCSEWERWAADVGESPSSYPILISFRPQDPSRSWVLALPDDPIELTRTAFDAGLEALVAAGHPLQREAAAAWPHFHGWRDNYERAAYAMADRIVAPPAPWSGARAHLPEETVLPDRPPNRQPRGPETSG